MLHILSKSFLVVLCASSVIAHPGEKHDQVKVKRELVARDYWAQQGKRATSACSNSTAARRSARRNAERRARMARELRAKRGITTAARRVRRDSSDVETWEAVNHNMTGQYAYNSSTAESSIFDSVTSSILAPEVTDGPYYVWGEYIRSDVVEDLYSDGVPLHLEIQYYDVETCEPVPNVYVDIWNCNATGVYSGISVNGNYAADGYNSTYLRGIQASDSEGVVTFDTIFPGHYDGRATHTHILSHMNVTVLSNNTLLVDTGTVTHIGQLFWNEELRSAVEAVEPYLSNTQAVTTNAEDTWAAVQASSAYDPFVDYLYLGDSISDGLFAWKQIGINTSADWTDNEYYAIAAYLQADGGHATSSGTMGGGSGGSFNGTSSGSFNGTSGGSFNGTSGSGFPGASGSSFSSATGGSASTASGGSFNSASSGSSSIAGDTFTTTLVGAAATVVAAGSAASITGAPPSGTPPSGSSCTCTCAH